MENTQILPLLSVIEALTSCMSADTSLLLRLAKIISDKYGEMGTNAREAVSLSILDGLAARDDEENDSISDSGERIKFDPSESCEDVLQQILEDVQAPDVENGGQKMLKWDVQSFIASKRARLNSPVLQKLKDAILDGSHSVIESLEERTGIAVRTRNNVSANVGHSDELVQRHEERGKNIEAVESSKTSNFASAEKCDDESQENVPEQNVLPAKRKRSHVSAEISERQAYNTIPNDMEDQETQLRSPANPVDEDNGKKLSGQVQGQNDKIGESHRGREGNELRTSSQDSLATQLKQLKLCMKCNKGGKVLECSSDTCAIAVHESCLGPTVNMDCEGRFYCPSCEYSRALSECLEVAKRAAKRATLARKKFTLFIGQKVVNQNL